MTESAFTFDGRTIPEQPVTHIFTFCCLMAVVVAARRGGRNSAYIRECYDFMADAIGKRLSVRDPLPASYDWRPSAAIECAETMMEYDA